MDIKALLFDPNLTLKNEKITLRILSPSDQSQLEKIALNPEIWKYFFIELNTVEDVRNYIASLVSNYLIQKNIPFVIIDNCTKQIIGMSSFGNISITDARIEIGWSWIGKDFQGKGFNTAYKHCLMEFAFDVLNFVRVEYKTDVLNLQARKALLKIGCAEEGVLRSHTLMTHNRRRDTIFYSVLKNEWDAWKK